jgi:hypothetical protein
VLEEALPAQCSRLPGARTARSRGSAMSSQAALREGMLWKQGHVVRNWKHRFFSLLEDRLVYFARAGDKRAKGHISLRGASVDERVSVRGREWVWRVVQGNGKTFLLQSANALDLAVSSQGPSGPPWRARWME